MNIKIDSTHSSHVNASNTSIKNSDNDNDTNNDTNNDNSVDNDSRNDDNGNDSDNIAKTVDINDVVVRTVDVNANANVDVNTDVDDVSVNTVEIGRWWPFDTPYYGVVTDSLKYPVYSGTSTTTPNAVPPVDAPAGVLYRRGRRVGGSRRSLLRGSYHNMSPREEIWFVLIMLKTTVIWCTLLVVLAMVIGII